MNIYETNKRAKYMFSRSSTIIFSIVFVHFLVAASPIPIPDPKFGEIVASLDHVSRDNGANKAVQRDRVLEIERSAGVENRSPLPELEQAEARGCGTHCT